MRVVSSAWQVGPGIICFLHDREMLPSCPPQRRVSAQTDEAQAEYFTLMTPELEAGGGSQLLLLDFILVAIIHP